MSAFNFAIQQHRDNTELMAKLDRLEDAEMKMLSTLEGNTEYDEDWPFFTILDGRTFTSEDSKKDLVEACKRSYEASNAYCMVYEYKLDDKFNVHKVNEKGKTALHSACSKGKVKRTALLIEKGANVNALDKNGNVPLHYAACRGREECLRLSGRPV